MTVLQFFVKIDLRMNKSATDDYDNLWKYVKAEALNKAINEWIRRQYKGKNQLQEGDEETVGKVDDLQVLLKRDNLGFRDKGVYVESNKLPTDYLYFKRLTPYVTKDECSSVRIESQLKEEANVDKLLHMCSFKFEETFHTLMGNKVNLYHNKDFSVAKLELVYYRKPIVYEANKLDKVIEFNDGICDILVDEACSIIASDIESLNAQALTKKRLEDNT